MGALRSFAWRGFVLRGPSNYVIKKAAVPGLEYRLLKLDHYRYLEIFHLRSGKPIYTNHNNPLDRVTPILSLANQIFAEFDWDRAEAALIRDRAAAEKVIWAFRNATDTVRGKLIVRPPREAI